MPFLKIGLARPSLCRPVFSPTGCHLLALLILTDAGFAVLHIFRTVGYLQLDEFLVSTERGYAEIFQYVKELWCSLILLLIAFKERSWLALMWALLFGYFFLDDSIGIHEQTDTWFGDVISFPSVAGVAPADVWQVATSLLVAFFFFVLIYFSYRASSHTRMRSRSPQLLTWVVLLAFFGVGVDAFHSLFRGRSGLDEALGLLEDAGEMVSMSVLLALIWSELTSMLSNKLE